MKKDTRQGKKPFFARLLETQELDHVVGGATTKAPSDSDELGDGRGMGALMANDATTKYPSDSDEFA